MKVSRATRRSVRSGWCVACASGLSLSTNKFYCQFIARKTATNAKLFRSFFSFGRRWFLNKFIFCPPDIECWFVHARLPHLIYAFCALTFWLLPPAHRPLDPRLDMMKMLPFFLCRWAALFAFRHKICISSNFHIFIYLLAPIEYFLSDNESGAVSASSLDK